MIDQETLDTVKEIFTSYLVTHSHRKTPERFTILKEIYLQNGHFDIETLYFKIKNKKHRVSRATLYNTIDLLLDSGLIVKHQFGKNGAQFERAYKFKQHDHAICMVCGKMFEFCDPRMQDIKQSVSKQFNFEISHHAITIYGRCNNHKKNI